MRSKIVRRQTPTKLPTRWGSTRFYRNIRKGKMRQYHGAMPWKQWWGPCIEFGYKKKNQCVCDTSDFDEIFRYPCAGAAKRQSQEHYTWMVAKNGHEVEFVQMSKIKTTSGTFRMAVMVNGDKISEAEDFNKKPQSKKAAELAIVELKIWLAGLSYKKLHGFTTQIILGAAVGEVFWANASAIAPCCGGNRWHHSWFGCDIQFVAYPL